jgi:hypothetical protein
MECDRYYPSCLPPMPEAPSYMLPEPHGAAFGDAMQRLEYRRHYQARASASVQKLFWQEVALNETQDLHSALGNWS